MARQYAFRRYSAGVNPRRQGNRRVAPAAAGWWAFPAGFEYGADNVPGLARPGRGQRWHPLLVPSGALIYTGWDRDGVITREGFFNGGDWHLLTAADAMRGLDRVVASARGYAASHAAEGWTWRRVIGPANSQVFIPAGTRVR